MLCVYPFTRERKVKFMGKNYKGGYKIVSLMLVSLMAGMETATIEGIYERIESSYQKPILLSGIVVGGVEKNDVFVQPVVEGNEYVLENVYGLDIHVNSDDEITIGNREISFDDLSTEDAIEKSYVDDVVEKIKRGYIVRYGSAVLSLITVDKLAQEDDKYAVFQMVEYNSDGEVTALEHATFTVTSEGKLTFAIDEI